MAHVPDIVNRAAKDGKPVSVNREAGGNAHNARAGDPSFSYNSENDEETWRICIESLLESTSSVVSIMGDGLEHAGIQFGFSHSAKKQNGFPTSADAAKASEVDVEANGQIVQPGDPRFSEILEQKLEAYMARRGETLTIWANGDDVASQPSHDSEIFESGQGVNKASNIRVRTSRNHLYLILYLQHMVS